MSGQRSPAGVQRAEALAQPPSSTVRAHPKLKGCSVCTVGRASSLCLGTHGRGQPPPRPDHGAQRAPTRGVSDRGQPQARDPLPRPGRSLPGSPPGLGGGTEPWCPAAEPARLRRCPAPPDRDRPARYVFATGLPPGEPTLVTPSRPSPEGPVAFRKTGLGGNPGASSERCVH